MWKEITGFLPYWLLTWPCVMYSHLYEVKLEDLLKIRSQVSRVKMWKSLRVSCAQASSIELKLTVIKDESQAWAIREPWISDVQAGFRKAEEPEIKLPTSAGSWKKQESSRKTSISALLTMPKPLTVWIIIHCGKFWKRWEYQTTWPASWETCIQVRKQQLELDMEQQTGSK